MTRPSDSQQKKKKRENLPIVDFAVPANHKEGKRKER